MELKEMISRRKSVRKYTGVPVDAATLQKIRNFGATVKPLYPDIKVHWEIVEKEQVRFYLPWKTPQLIAVYSENKPGYLENAGFIFQQMDLYLQSIGLGVCWLGLGKMRQRLDSIAEGMEFVILLAFGHPEGEALRTQLGQFQRKTLSEISDVADSRLEPARLAPSSTNSQPWLFAHEGDTIHAYCSQKGRARHVGLGAMNKIDMGIALAHLYVANEETFTFFKAENPPTVPGYGYIGSVTNEESYENID